jgi:hypothetical protein
VRKAKTTEHTRYVPTYNAQIAEGLRSFRPKQTVVDLQRSNSLLQRSLQSQRLQFSALQAQKAALVLTARGHCEVAKSLVVEKQLSNTRRLRSAQFRRERDAAQGELQVAKTANAELIEKQQQTIAQLEFQCEMDIQEAKEYEAKRARTMIQEAVSEALDDKETGIAKAKKSASKYRRLWQKAELTVSHAQSKLEVTVNEFEAKTAAVKRRNHNDVKGLLTEMSTLVTNTGNERKRSVGHQAKFRGHCNFVYWILKWPRRFYFSNN